MAKREKTSASQAIEAVVTALMVDKKALLMVDKGHEPSTVSSMACMSAQVSYAVGIDFDMVAIG